MKTIDAVGIELENICKPERWKRNNIFYYEDYLVGANGKIVKISYVNYMSCTFIIDSDSWEI